MVRVDLGGRPSRASQIPMSATITRGPLGWGPGICISNKLTGEVTEQTAQVGSICPSPHSHTQECPGAAGPQETPAPKADSGIKRLIHHLLAALGKSVHLSEPQDLPLRRTTKASRPLGLNGRVRRSSIKPLKNARCWHCLDGVRPVLVVECTHTTCKEGTPIPPGLGECIPNWWYLELSVGAVVRQKDANEP